MEIVKIIVGVVVALIGWFGIPEIITRYVQLRQKIRIKTKAEKLNEQLKKGIDKKYLRAPPAFTVFNELQDLLWYAKDVIKNKEFLQEQLNKIIRNLYKTGMNEFIQELRAKFQNDFEFSVESWANIAIANINLYRLDGMSEYREYCLEACKESIKRQGNYGTPRALILIIHMIDYERKKQINKDDAQNMINEVNSGDDTMVSYDTYNYLLITKKIHEWEKYIDHLFNLYPSEMDKMKNRYEKYKSTMELKSKNTITH